MTGEGGYFEKGRWVDEPSQPETGDSEAESPQPDIDNRIRDATQSVVTGVSDLLRLGHDLIATEEGRDHLDKKIGKSVRKLEEVCDELSQEAESLISRIRKKIS
jgi:hypothetical protein